MKEFFADEKLRESLEKFINFDPKEAISSLPVFFQALTRVVCIRGKEMGVSAFNVFMKSAIKIQDMLGVAQRPRNGLLHYFITYAFDNERDCEREPVEVILNNWVFLCAYILTGREKELSIESFFHNSWLFFDVIVKSIALTRDENHSLECKKEKKKKKFSKI